MNFRPLVGNVRDSDVYRLTDFRARLSCLSFSDDSKNVFATTVTITSDAEWKAKLGKKVLYQSKVTMTLIMS